MRQTYARFCLAFGILAALLTSPGSATSAHGQTLDQEVVAALTRLYDTTPAVRNLDATAGTMARRPTAPADTYASVFGETDLPTGVGIEGWKINKTSP